MAISLGIPGGRVQVFYLQFLAKVPIDPIVKLRPIIRYDISRDVEPTDNVFLDEPSNISIFDGREGVSLYLFTEIIDGDQQWFLLGRCGGKQTHNINPLLSEWPRARDGDQILHR